MTCGLCNLEKPNPENPSHLQKGIDAESLEILEVVLSPDRFGLEMSSTNEAVLSEPVMRLLLLKLQHLNQVMPVTQQDSLMILLPNQTNCRRFTSYQPITSFYECVRWKRRELAKINKMLCFSCLPG